ncbi:MAG: sigma 54-interacting transcriptional regulator, partial [Planctomycetes bacterium]|nr:sigma 54-interacting transcriptional regulator [Planctomycetota bacterium]
MPVIATLAGRGDGREAKAHERWSLDRWRLGCDHFVITREFEIDFRVVAATNKELDAAVKSGEFREDLYHRLGGFIIELPVLRKRPSDIPL